jgi:four helix bundle protein
MRDFRSLEIWNQGHSLTLDIYQVTEKFFPRVELYGLTSQIRRASASIPTNIAEGCGRRTQAEFNQFLQIAIGSSSEVEYQLQLARDLNYIDDACFETLSSKVVMIRKMMTTFIAHSPNPKVPKARPHTSK